MNVVCLLLTISLHAPQDFKEARARFLEGCRNLDAADAADYGDKLASADSEKAVDVLLKGYAIVAGGLKELWARKQNLIAKMDRYMYEVDPKTNRVKDRSKLNQYLLAQKEANQVERDIARINEVKTAIIENLGKIRETAGIRKLIRKMKAAKEWTIRAGLAEALGGSDNEQVEPALIAQLKKDKDIGVRVAILDSLAERTPLSDAALEAIGDVVANGTAWQTRYTAAKAIEKQKAKKAVPHLIAALKTAEGRLKWEINDILKRMTGADKHGDHDAWDGWWRANGEAWLAGSFTEKSKEGGKAVATATFYDIPIKSNRLVFILDRSGSMREPSRWKEKATVGTGGADVDHGVKLEGKRKIDVARYNLKKALVMLLARSKITKRPVEFNVMFYNQQVVPMSRKLVTLDKSSLRKAFAFIDRLAPNGGTNIHDALERGFSYAAKGADSALSEKGIDTIFLLSDGMPTVGQITETREILKKFARNNKLAKVVINTVYVGLNESVNDRTGNTFMRELADQNNGEFKGPPE